MTIPLGRPPVSLSRQIEWARQLASFEVMNDCGLKAESDYWFTNARAVLQSLERLQAIDNERGAPAGDEMVGGSDVDSSGDEP